MIDDSHLSRGSNWENSHLYSPCAPYFTDFVGSSIAKDSLNIWMANFPKDGGIDTEYRDSCGVQYTTMVRTTHSML